MTRSSVLVTSALSCAALCGCVGKNGVTITGTLGDRPLRATGTVAAWIDATTYVRDNGPIALVDRPSADTVLHIEMFEAVFDPSLIATARTAAETLTLSRAIADGDRLSFVIARGESLRDGDTIATLGADGVPEVLPFIDDVAIALRADVGAAAAYPDSIATTGSDVTATFTVETVSPVLEGTIELDVEAADDEGDAALTGSLSIALSTELLPERIAECNFARGDASVVDPCTLAPLDAGLPAQDEQ